MQTTYSNFEQGDIVTADIVYSQQFGFKRRPVLVASSTKYNNHSEDIIVVSISSSTPRTKYDVKLINNDLQEGKLKLESKIITDFPTTIEKTLISQKIGKITS
ncbi:MAG: type II toxin-antitoxin system PemK/MazF family toxin, partial [archaeon]|nr:type II toxin-antitoxin system PemK/MazF family toxin [archaeon]